jgi:hypothetical protein
MLMLTRGVARIETVSMPHLTPLASVWLDVGFIRVTFWLGGASGTLDGAVRRNTEVKKRLRQSQILMNFKVYDFRIRRETETSRTLPGQHFGAQITEFAQLSPAERASSTLTQPQLSPV